MTDKNILFVCTGNICRSPMAEYMLASRLSDKTDWDVRSAGVFAGNGMVASRLSVETLDEIGIDMRSHRSRALGRELVDWASVVVVMTGSHRDQISTLFPDAMEKVFLLKSFDPECRSGDVEDPIGLPIGVYRSVRGQVESALPELISFVENLDVN